MSGSGSGPVGPVRAVADGGDAGGDDPPRDAVSTRLHERTRELVRVTDEDGIGEVVVDTVRDLLGYDVAAVVLLADGEPRVLAASEAARDSLADATAADDSVWSTDGGDDAVRLDADGADPESVDGGVVLPLGGHGFLRVGGPDDAVDPADLEHLRLLAGGVETALHLAARESSLRRDRDRIATLFENTSDAIVEVVDEEGRATVTAVNPAFERTFGVDAAAVVGTDLDRIVAPPDGYDEAARLTDRVHAGERLETEVRRETADGLRDFLLRAVPFEFEGERNRGYAIYTDITERKRFERTLGRLHETARDLMHAEGAEAVADVAVAAAADILGFPVNGVRLYEESTDALVLAAASETTEAVLGERPPYPRGEGLVWEAFEAGEVRVVEDLAAVDDGYDRPGLTSAMYLPLGDHGTLSLGATDEAGFDDADVHLAGVLAANVEAALDRADRTGLLRRRERELARQNERLEEFASVVSHDLRNPLSVAIGHLELARSADDPAVAEDHFGRVERAHDRMDDLITDLLSLARQGQTVGETERVSLQEVAERAWRSVETGAATLAVAGDRTLPADPERLTALFENLFRNSVEHGSTGSRPEAGDVAGHAGSDVAVTVGATDDGFFVADDGPGVPPADRDRVFEHGYSTAGSGTGFGLNIVRSIARAHGWEVSLTESADGGARFDVTGVDDGTVFRR
jgi:PAS domain S-box-containing protein